MTSPTIGRRWQLRLQWATTVATAYAVLYLSFVTFEQTLRGESTVAYLLGPGHEFLADPLGLLFLASLPVVLVGVSFSLYVFLAGD